MKKFKNIINLLTFSLLLVSCSNQWSEGDAGLGEGELIPVIDEITQQAQANGAGNIGDLDYFRKMVNDPNSSIYFAEGWLGDGSPMGPPNSVLGFLDFTFLGQPDHTALDLETGRAIFVDRMNELGQRENALLISYRLIGDDKFYTRVFIGKGNAHIEDGLFVSELYFNNTATGIYLESQDTLDSDELAGVVQFQIWEFDNSGEYYAGQISAMIGYY